MDTASRRHRVGHRFLAPIAGAVVLGAALTLRAAGGPGVPAPQAAPLPSSPVQSAQPASHSFQADVWPVLERNCTRCHDAQHPTAGLIVASYSDPASLATRREGWELIVDRLLAGEMPPPGEDGPSDEEVSALVSFVQAEFDRADRTATPDPGRVTAHRLNRVEYQNTIRDLLGVDFRATEEFPADDSGYGFDNNGDVLTVSPALMQQYLAAAEKIAARAVGGDPFPEPGIFTRRESVRRAGDSAIELKTVVEYDAEYVVRVNVTGHRGAEDPPVTLAISVDGAPIKTVEVPVQMSAVNKQGGGTQRSVQEARVFLPGNEHVFRAEFVNDEGLAKIPENQRRNSGQNIFPDTIEIAGPYPSGRAARGREEGAALRPGGRPELRHAHRADAGAARLPPAGDERRGRRADARVRSARRPPATRRRRASSSCWPRCSSRRASCSVSSATPALAARAGSPTSSSPRGSATFSGARCRTTSCLRLAEASRLHQPAVLEAQVARMIADPKSSALADNFAGQWLETRSLDAVKRDPQKFPEWNAELRDAMREETRLFFEAVLREDRPISDFVDGRYTFLNERLARHYGIPRRRRARIPARRADDRPARRGVHAGERADGLELSDAHLGRAARQVPPRERAERAGAASAAGRAAARRSGRRRRAHPARRRWSSTGPTPSARAATARWIRSASASRTTTPSAAGACRTASSRWTRAAPFPSGHTFSGPAEMKALLSRQHAGVHASALAREDADLRARPRRRGVRPLRAVQDLVAADGAAGLPHAGARSRHRQSRPVPAETGGDRERRRPILTDVVQSWGSAGEAEMIVTKSRFAARGAQGTGRRHQSAVPRRDGPGLRRRAERGAPPVRLAWFYVPNGIDMRHWTPAAEGPLGTLPGVLAPLQPVKHDILVLSNLTRTGDVRSWTARATTAARSAAYMTGVEVYSTAGADLKLGDLGRPDRRQRQRPPDEAAVARSRPRGSAPGRQLRQRLLLRLRLQRRRGRRRRSRCRRSPTRASCSSGSSAPT